MLGTRAKDSGSKDEEVGNLGEKGSGGMKRNLSPGEGVNNCCSGRGTG
jgi:hypothetical protein